MSEEINILLLGETGAGKTTTLNALANILKFKTFEEITKSIKNLTEIVPSQFTYPDSTGKQWEIKSKFSDANENLKNGDSATQAPTAYKFFFDNKVLRIIDTPGIGDTGGSEKDKKNFEQILQYLQQYNQLNGIVIIIKSSENRNTLYLKYCITELIFQLHRNVMQNIVFCFTYSQISPGTFGQGESFKTIKAFLEDEIKSVNIKLEPGKNAFFIDNDAYRYLVAKSQGYPGNDIQEMLHGNCWKHSAEEFKKMFNHIFSFSPHKLTETISLNNARKIAAELTEPIAHLSQNIEENINKIEQMKKELELDSFRRNNLATVLETTTTDLEKRPLKNPQMICTSKKCTEVITVDGQEEIVYKSVCHKPCLCLGASAIFGNFVKKFCDAMDRSYLTALILDDVKCTFCTCKWADHKPINFYYEKVTRKIFVGILNEEIDNDIETKQFFIKAAQDKLDLLKFEKTKIEEIVSKFAYFIKTNSSFIYNRYFENYIDMLIAQEKLKKNSKIEFFINLKHRHIKNVKDLEKTIKNNPNADVTVENIFMLKKELLELKHNGPIFQQILEANEEVRLNVQNQEITVASISIDIAKKLFSSLFNNQ